ncbi:hypothetical protein HZS_2536, partial [Henneguya salminicola]
MDAGKKEETEKLTNEAEKFLKSTYEELDLLVEGTLPSLITALNEEKKEFSHRNLAIETRRRNELCDLEKFSLLSKKQIEHRKEHVLDYVKAARKLRRRNNELKSLEKKDRSDSSSYKTVDELEELVRQDVSKLSELIKTRRIQDKTS